MHVVEQMRFGAELTPEALEERRHRLQVALAAPDRLRQRAALGGFVGAAGGHAVHTVEPRHGTLGAHRSVPLRDESAGRGDGGLDGGAARVPVDHHRVARGAAEQLVHGGAERLPLDVPERGVDGGDGRHGHRPAAPVGALVEELPDVFDAPRVAPLEERQHVVTQVRCDGELASVERRVAQSVDAVFGLELERDEVAPRAADDDLAADDLHSSPQADLKVRSHDHYRCTRPEASPAARRSTSATLTRLKSPGMVCFNALAATANRSAASGLFPPSIP